MRDVTITRDQSRDTGMAMVLLLLLALLKWGRSELLDRRPHRPRREHDRAAGVPPGRDRLVRPGAPARRCRVAAC